MNELRRIELLASGDKDDEHDGPLEVEGDFNDGAHMLPRIEQKSEPKPIEQIREEAEERRKREQK